MIAMHYSFTLPADYDMDRIRTRVVARSATFDHMPQLDLKAFLIAERGKHGSNEHVYAPFYV